MDDNSEYFASNIFSSDDGNHLRIKHCCGKLITVVTAYDYPFVVCLNEAGIDLCLVGNSASMVVIAMGGARANWYWRIARRGSESGYQTHCSAWQRRKLWDQEEGLGALGHNRDRTLRRRGSSIPS